MRILNFFRDGSISICALLIIVKELENFTWKRENPPPRPDTTHIAIKNLQGRSEHGLFLNRLEKCQTASAEGYRDIRGIFSKQILYVSTNRPRRPFCPTFGGSQSHFHKS